MVRKDESAIKNVDLGGMRSSLNQTNVVFAILFGSHARGDAESGSDVDVALYFPDELNARDRFQMRNRIDAGLQQYASGFVDVSDIEQLPTSVAYAALRDGILLIGDEDTVAAYQDRIEEEYESTLEERERERREFIDRLASGDA